MFWTMLAVLTGILVAPAQAADRDDRGRDKTVRFATYNASLNRAAAGQLVSDLSTRDNAQARNIAEVLQRVRPDVVLLNEFDYVEGYEAVEPVPYATTCEVRSRAPGRSATRTPSPRRRTPASPAASTWTATARSAAATTRTGSVSSPASSAWSCSRATRSTRTGSAPSRRFLWKDMPGALLPDDPATPQPGDWYSEEILEVFRLSSKSHWDVPVRVQGAGRCTCWPRTRLRRPSTAPRTATARRNHDEIRLLGRLRHAGGRPLHLRRRGPPRRAAARVPLRDHGRPERRPAGRRLGGRGDRPAAGLAVDPRPEAVLGRRGGGGVCCRAGPT